MVQSFQADKRECHLMQIQYVPKSSWWSGPRNCWSISCPRISKHLSISCPSIQAYLVQECTNHCKIKLSSTPQRAAVGSSGRDQEIVEFKPYYISCPRTSHISISCPRTLHISISCPRTSQNKTFQYIHGRDQGVVDIWMSAYPLLTKTLTKLVTFVSDQFWSEKNTQTNTFIFEADTMDLQVRVWNQHEDD